ncbi:MAG: alpha-amylase family glycosyl hydrolase [Synechococcaceae cyanobacterium]
MGRRCPPAATAAALAPLLLIPGPVSAQPTAILHAHNEPYRQVATYVCQVGAQGYSHVQIAPAQRSSAGPEWWRRYQPLDHTVIEGRGSAADLRALTRQAHRCGVKVIADLVVNHMASGPPSQTLRYPGLTAADFHRRCPIHYSDGNTVSERRCWLNGDLPDLNQQRPAVRKRLRQHIRTLVDLGVDGFRFDAAKHLDPAAVADLLTWIRTLTGGRSWSYLEVIDDADTRPEMYSALAPLSDFRFCDRLRQAFSFGGSLRSLHRPEPGDDPRAVRFGVNHDTDHRLNPGFGRCRMEEPGDGWLASATVLAREAGTPLILARDNLEVAYLPAGARFRAELRRRALAGRSTGERALEVGNPDTLLLLERGAEGFFLVNKAAERVNLPAVALTNTRLQGCYRELRHGFTARVAAAGDGRRWITRWGSDSRGGLEVHGRDALYFLRVAAGACPRQ